MIGEKGNRMEFSAGEALMLLDILKNEETEIEKDGGIGDTYVFESQRLSWGWNEARGIGFQED